MWLDNEPELAEAYRLKEAFYAIYELPKADAEPAFDGFAATVPPGLKADFKVLTRAMGNWRTEILAYFDHPITNAYTEALNGVAKAINRWGRLPSRQAARYAPLTLAATRGPARGYLKMMGGRNAAFAVKARQALRVVRSLFWSRT